MTDFRNSNQHWRAPKALALPRFWVSIRSYKKQPVKKNWGRILGLAWLKFAVAPFTLQIEMAKIYSNTKGLAILHIVKIN